jgi:hypothetical protein
MRSAGELPNEVTFNSSIGKGCAEQGHAEKAVEAFEKMKPASELPDEGKFNGWSTQHGETKRSEEICEEMKSGCIFGFTLHVAQGSSVGLSLQANADKALLVKGVSKTERWRH